MNQNEAGAAGPAKEPGAAALQAFLSVLFSAAAFWPAARLAAALYRPDAAAAEAARALLVVPASAAPEPLERFLFVFGVVFFAAAVPLFFSLARKLTRRLDQASLCRAETAACLAGAAAVLAAAALGFQAHNPFFTAPKNAHDALTVSNWDFYFTGTFIGAHPALFALALFPALSFYLLKRGAAAGRSESAAAAVWAGLLCAAVFAVSAFRFPYTYENMYDFGSVYYSVAQVYAGLPLLVDGFTNTYGLYPHFLLPILKFTGVSVAAVAGLLALLAALCFALLWAFLRRAAGAGPLAAAGLTAAFYFSWLHSRTVMNYDAYFAMLPIRWLPPCALLAWAASREARPGTRAYAASLLLAAAGVLWNPDFGGLTLLALAAWYAFLEFEGSSPSAALKKAPRHFAAAAAALTGVWAAWALFVRAGYGAWPDPRLLVSAPAAFASAGLGMLPLPRGWHPWLLVALVYLAGLAAAARGALAGRAAGKPGLYFLLAFVGAGSLQYYAGRSHNWNLTACSPWAFLLLTMLAADLTRLAGRSKAFLLPTGLALLVLTAGLVQTAGAAGRLTYLLNPAADKADSGPETDRIKRNAAALRAAVRPGERVLVMSADYYQAYYHALSGTGAAVNPGLGEMFLLRDLQRLKSFLENNSGTKVLLDAQTFRGTAGLSLLLSALYDPPAVPGAPGELLLLEPKRPDPARRPLLGGGKPLFHQVFGARRGDLLPAARAQLPVSAPGSAFTVQAVFKPAAVAPSQFTGWMTVLRCGSLLIAQRDQNQNTYFVTLGGRELVFPVSPGRWTYLALEVSGSAVRLYLDGRPVMAGDAGAPYRHDGALRAGSYDGENGLFWGDLRELRLSAGSLDPGAADAARRRLAAGII